MIDNQTLDQKIDIPTDFLRIHSRTFSKVRRNSFLRVFSMKTNTLWQILQFAIRHLSQRIHLPMPNIKLIPFILQKTLKSAYFTLFICIVQKNTLPLHRIQCKGSRWESCTVPLLWFAIRCSNSYKSLVLSELGRLNKRSDKSEDLLRATNEELVKLNALGESSQRHDRQVFNIIYGTHVRV